MKFVYKGKTGPCSAYIGIRLNGLIHAIGKRTDFGKVLMTMKLTVLIFLIGTLQVLAENTYGQQISLKKKDATLLEVLKSVRKQTGYLFICDLDMLAQAEKVSISAENAPMKEVLDACFKDQPLTYSIVDKTIIVKKKKEPVPKPKEEASLKEAFRFGSDRVLKERMTELMQRKVDLNAIFDISVTGKVTDEKGDPLAGVNVIQKGTQRGSSTDSKGVYNIDITDADAVLTFSFVGFTSQEVIVGRRSNIDVTLKIDNKALEEVVVVGYGTQKRSDLTGAVSSVKAEDIKSLPVRSVNEALQGRAAGVQVTRNDGSPGASSDIVIRGVGSIGGMSPLYIVDGIRMSAGNNFNLQDVESIEILKDASAAAIYGAQAAGGVVLVTTKRGTQGSDKMNINFNAYYGVRQARNLYKMLNTADYVAAKSAFGVNTSGWGDPSTLADNDWADQVYRSGSDQSYSLSLSGATAKTNYYLSANYQREGGTMIDNDFERYGLRSNADFKINNRLKVGETLYAWRTGNNPVQTSTFPFRSAPVVPVYDPSNPVGGWAKTGTFFTGPNLVANELINHAKNIQYALEGNVYLDWEIIKGLNFRSTFGASIYSGANYKFTEAYDFGTLKNINAFLSRDLNNSRNLTGNFVLTYGKVFGRHDIKAMVGYEAYQSDLSNLHGEAQGFQVITYNLGMTTNPSTFKASGGEFPQTRLLSQFGRINYTFADKYLFTANVRRDGSDRFGPANKWGVFPSFSAGWRLSEEAFVRDNLPQVSNLKLRASYGKLGSTSSIPQYTYQASYGGGGGTNILGLPDGSRSKGYALTAQLPNEGIKWEQVNQTDVGLEVGLFKNALNITADWYSRQTQDMIYQVPVPVSSGFYGTNGVFTNIGQMSNKGIELTVDFRGKAKDFTYAINANAAFNRNLVKQLSGTNNNPINDGTAGDYLESTVTRTQAGRPLSQFYGYIVEGLFQSDAEVASLNQKAQEAAAAAGGSSTGIYYQNSGTGAGDLQFRDLNGDGRITIDDKTFIGNPWPKMTYGFSINLGWKGIDLQAMFQGVQGVDVFNANKYYTQFFVGDYNTTRDIFNTSFFNGGGLTDQPRIGTTDASGNYVRDPNSNYTRISSFVVENGSFLKLRNLQIGYTLPSDLVKRMKMTGLRIYLQGQNLLTFTKYSGLDPEILGRNGTTARGLDTIYSYPRTRLLSMGIDLSF
jgi:TonB-linked SusC/RagA family outer membrane protein